MELIDEIHHAVDSFPACRGSLSGGIIAGTQGGRVYPGDACQQVWLTRLFPLMIGWEVRQRAQMDVIDSPGGRIKSSVGTRSRRREEKLVSHLTVAPARNGRLG